MKLFRRGQSPLLNRSPIQNNRASHYMLLMLLSFAFSVSVTRLFLYLTGFPKIGGGNLHIAHVLWGGLLLFIGCLFPLVLVNNWAHTWSAILCGVGIGLFIDEVGKFITANNDYFYASAAPIIYAFFLLSVLLFVQIKSWRKPSARGEMYIVLNDLNEVLDQDLSPEERDALLKRLQPIVQQQSEPELSRLASALTDFLASPETRTVEYNPSLIDKIQNAWFSFEIKWMTRAKLKRILLVLLIAWGAWALFYPIGYLLSSHDPNQLQTFIQAYLSDRLYRNASGFNWVEARVYMEGSLGLLALLAAALIIAKKEKLGVLLAYIDMLITLTVVNLVIFYFDQFSTIFFAIPQFVLLILIIRYRERFIHLHTVGQNPNSGA